MRKFMTVCRINMVALSRERGASILAQRSGLPKEVARKMVDMSSEHPKVPYKIVKDAAEMAVGWGVGFANIREKELAERNAEKYLNDMEKFCTLAEDDANASGWIVFTRLASAAMRGDYDRATAQILSELKREK